MPRQKLTQKFVDTVAVTPAQRKVDYFDTERKGLMLRYAIQAKLTI